MSKACNPWGRVFVSSGAYGRASVETILGSAMDEGVANLELASGTRHASGDGLASLLCDARRRGYDFLVHNYFPVPDEPFVLNLASADATTLERSIRHVMQAIDLAAAIGSPFYSVHCGFCVDPAPEDLGRELTGSSIPVEQASAIFVDSVRRVADHGRRRGVDLLLENNVLAPMNAGRVQLLGVTPEDLESILDHVDRPNVALLLDVAHLKVSAVTLGFDMVAAARRLAPRVRCAHLSDNDGRRDSNQVVDHDAWFWEPLLGALATPAAWVLEAYNLDPDVIRQQVRLIESHVAPADRR